MRSHTRCGEDFDISSDDTNGNIRSFNCYQWYSDMQSSLELSKEWHRPNSQSVNSISQATANPLQRQKDNSLHPYKSSLERNEFLSPDRISVTRQIQCCCSQDANVNRISEHHHGRINKIVTLEGDITRDQWNRNDCSGLRIKEHQRQCPCSEGVKSHKRTSVKSHHSHQSHHMQQSHLFKKRQTIWELNRGSHSRFTDRNTLNVKESRSIDVKQLCEEYPVNAIKPANDTPTFHKEEDHRHIRTTDKKSYHIRIQNHQSILQFGHLSKIEIINSLSLSTWQRQSNHINEERVWLVQVLMQFCENYLVDLYILITRVPLFMLTAKLGGLLRMGQVENI